MPESPNTIESETQVDPAQAPLFDTPVAEAPVSAEVAPASETPVTPEAPVAAEAPAYPEAPVAAAAPVVPEAPVAPEAPAAPDAPVVAKAATAPEEPVGFAAMALHPTVAASVVDLGYETPTPIQERTIPALLEGRDVIGLAQTGTGKTAAFALPTLSAMAELGRANNGPHALVLTPTRELAIQVAEAFSSYASHLSDFSVLPIYGGQAYGPQLSGLRRGAQVVVGTPGRVIDHLKRGSLALGSLRHFILDEADEMLKMGFQEDIEQIFAATGSTRQVALFSATMPGSIHRITKKYLNNPVEVRVDSKTTAGPKIRQRFLTVMHSHKLDALTRVLEIEEYDGTIMFVRTKQATEELAEKLRARGYTASAINGDVPQQARERTVEHLRNGQIDILVATDVAARGLDVERIELVVNYDIPHDTESYVHRIGRTGRAGRSGEAILFVTPRETHMLRQIEKATRQQVEKLELPTVEQLTNSRVARFAGRITEAMSSTDLSEVRPVIEEYIQTHNVPAEEVASALAMLLLDGESLKANPLPEPKARTKSNERGERSSGRSNAGMRTYRIAVGRNDRVQPGGIVGAIANEGGLTSAQIGAIDIRTTHSLVDLPENMTEATLGRLSRTKIQGRAIDIRPDKGRPGRPNSSGGSDRGGYRGDRPDARRSGRPGGGRDVTRADAKRSFRRND